MIESASKLCKYYGLKGVKDLSEYTNVSVRTLTEWNNNKPHLFRLMLIAAVSIKHGQVLRDLIE